MEKPINDLIALDKAIEADANLQNEFKDNPITAMKTIVKNSNYPAYVKDRLIYRIVVLSLGISVISIVVGTLLLMSTRTIKDSDIPTILTALGSAAIGAIAGLLAPSPNGGRL